MSAVSLRIFQIEVVCLAGLLLGGCGGDSGGSATYTVGGSVAGLVSGRSLVLQNNGGNNTPISVDAAFTFSTVLAAGSPYAVTVLMQPPGEQCSVMNASGVVGTANVSVAVNCTPNSYSISVTVAGLHSGSKLVLQNSGNNASTDITVSSDGSFAFANQIPSGSVYSVTVINQPSGQTCALQNGMGTVGGSNVSNVSVKCSPIRYAIHVDVTGISAVSGLVLQNNGADNLAVLSSGAFSFPTLVSSGSPYAVTISTQPTGHTCLVINGTGAVTDTNVSVSVVCPGHILYSADGAPSISAYYLDQATGKLSASVVGSPFSIASGAIPSAVALTPDRQFAYAPDAAGKLSAFAVNSTTGALTTISGSPYSVGTNLTSMAIDPTGRFLYVIDAASNTIAGFAINLSTGALTGVPGSPFSATSGPSGGNQSHLAIDPSGQFLYAAGAALLAFTINATTGALNPVPGSPFTSNERFQAITITPNDRFVICAGVSGPLQSAVFVYSINGSTGALTALGIGSQNGIFFTSVAVDPTSRFVYVGDNGIGSSNIEAFSFDSSTGNLTPVAGSPYPVNNPNSLVIDSSDDTMYAGGGGIYEFKIDSATGALSTIQGNQGSASTGSIELFVSHGP